VKYSPPSGYPRNGKRFAAVLLLLSLWLGMWALGAFPELHRLLHSDAQSPGHNCLVTQLQHHSVLPVVAVTAAPAPQAAWNVLDRHPDFLASASFDYRLSPSRAPPVL